MTHHSYCVRITEDYETLIPLIDAWSPRIERFAVYEHIGERTNKTHCHMVIERSAIAKDQLKNIAKGLGINLKGNEQCSFKAFDGDDKAYIYMTKGILNAKFLKHWTSTDTDAWKKRWIGDKGHQISKDALAYEDCFAEITYGISWKYYQRDNPNTYIPGYDRISDNDYHYRYMKKYAHSYAFQRYGRIWNIQASNLYKMLVYTYVYRNDLTIPKDDPAFKNM